VWRDLALLCRRLHRHILPRSSPLCWCGSDNCGAAVPHRRHGPSRCDLSLPPWHRLPSIATIELLPPTSPFSPASICHHRTSMPVLVKLDGLLAASTACAHAPVRSCSGGGRTLCVCRSRQRTSAIWCETATGTARRCSALCILSRCRSSCWWQQRSGSRWPLPLPVCYCRGW